jgi:hypothetical protein
LLGEWMKLTSVRSQDQKKTVTSELSHTADQRLDPQNHEKNGIR